MGGEVRREEGRGGEERGGEGREEMRSRRGERRREERREKEIKKAVQLGNNDEIGHEHSMYSHLHITIQTFVSSGSRTAPLGSVMAELNLLKMMGSTGTGTFCSVQWSV